MTESNKNVADSIDGFFEKSLLYIGPGTTVASSASAVIRNADFADINSSEKNLGKRFYQLLADVAQHYKTSDGRLPVLLVSGLDQLGHDLSGALEKAKAALDPYDKGMDHVPARTAAAFSQGMVAADMLDIVNRVYTHEYAKASSLVSNASRSEFSRREQSFRIFQARHEKDAHRLQHYHQHRENLRQEDASWDDAPSVPEYSAPPSLPTVAPGETNLPKTSIITEKGDKYGVRHKYDTPLQGHEWAGDALNKLQREIVAIRRIAPELLGAFEADNGELVVTQGKSTLYEEFEFGTGTDALPEGGMTPAGRSQYISWKGDKNQGTPAAVIFPHTVYPSAEPVRKIRGSSFMEEVNVAAHEIAHQGDRKAAPVQMEKGAVVVDVGYHTYSNLFGICSLLDEAFEPHGAARFVRGVLSGISDYGGGRETFLQELLPRTLENYVSNPVSRLYSPVMMRYIEDIFLQDMSLKAQNEKTRRAELKEGMEAGFQNIFADQAPVFDRYTAALTRMETAKLSQGDWSDSFMRAREQYAVAKVELLQHKDQLQKRITEFMKQLKSNSQQPKLEASANTLRREPKPLSRNETKL